MRFNENPNFDVKKYYEELNWNFKTEKERDNRIIMEMKNTDNYINWLEKFTLKYPIFYDYIISLSEFANLDAKDRENINNLRIFFDMIDNYAKENYIYFLDEDENYYIKYFIKHNNVCYIIGYDNIYCTSYRVERVPNEKISEIDSYIEYKDIQTNKKQPNTDIINLQLYSLANIIYEYSTNVPFEALKEKVYNTLQNIENNRNDFMTPKYIKIKKK